MHAKSRVRSPAESLASQFCERSFPLANGSLNFAVGPGNGPPLVLLHGVTRCWRDFSILLDDLATAYEVFAVDFRGHGKSSWQAGAYTVSDYLSDITAFLREEIRRPAVLFGHSLGALVSGVIASRNPELAAALILEDPPLSVLGSGIRETLFFPQFAGIKRLISEGDVQSDLVRKLSEMAVRNPETGKEVRFDQLRSPQSLHSSAECLSQIDPAVLTPLLEGRWMERIDMMKQFKEIRCPVLLLRGESCKGAMLTIAEANDLSAELNNCKLVEVLGAGHLIHESQPARTLELLSDFLEPLRQKLNLNR